MTVAGQGAGHHLLRFTGIQIHLQPSTGLDLLQGQLAADVIQRAGSAAQIKLRSRIWQGRIVGGGAHPNSPPNRPLL